MYSFSTCWNSHRHADGRALLREVRDLGFQYAELGHGTRMSLMPGILQAVDDGEIRISSLHNFCPLPIGVNHAAPNLYEFSDERSRQRELAVRHTLKTIEFAERLKAPIVVLHIGHMEIRPWTAKLLELVARGEKDTARYRDLCAELDKKRESKKRKTLDRVINCLKKILPEAESRGIKLAVENREALEELPVESDFHLLFRELPSPNLVYWHDTGHAQIKENLGFIHHAMHLESLADHLAGFHLHDVQFPGRDHCAPGTGTVDFAALRPLVKPAHIKVFEFSPALTAEEARRGVESLQRVWGVEG